MHLYHKCNGCESKKEEDVTSGGFIKSAFRCFTSTSFTSILHIFSQHVIGRD
jgi:hypothetical protein